MRVHLKTHLEKAVVLVCGGCQVKAVVKWSWKMWQRWSKSVRFVLAVGRSMERVISVWKVLLEISSSLIHHSLEANSRSENHKTVDCQKLRTVLRKWYLLTHLTHQFPKHLLTNQCQRQVTGLGYPWYNPCFSVRDPVAPPVSPNAHLHTPCKQGSDCSVVVIYIVIILPLPLALLAHWGGRRGESHSHHQIPCQDSGPAAPSAGYCSAGATAAFAAGKALWLAAPSQRHTQLQCVQVWVLK